MGATAKHTKQGSHGEKIPLLVTWARVGSGAAIQSNPHSPVPLWAVGCSQGEGQSCAEGLWLHKHSHTVTLGNAFWKYTTHPMQSQTPPSTQLCLKSQRAKYLQQEDHFVEKTALGWILPQTKEKGLCGRESIKDRGRGGNILTHTQVASFST